ncbi:CaiB/BaiF CoA transferase family protein [Haloarcula pellucida]|uniref:CoA transferase n=1 Tax=Haloarcula pellucida TaxID=1427151 RepID=A0A830GIG4_9EURY|nr:CoA transferase [Halomicroarcula pellucida]MBX0347434.1 CoA transferase [Halomicroarcula pellucida]GGN88656.1 CoA transferase [Halomicroarcula pellucida]
MERALDGVTIADFTQMMQGPWATQKLGDMGADVRKVERLGGEWERDLRAGGELLDGTSPFFLAMNRNKRSITVDLKAEAGRDVALDVAREADVLVENFRPGVMDSFGLGYDDVQAVNPEIIYVSATGFGRDGPYVDRPGQDLLLQSMSGLANYTGRKDDPPTPAGTAVVDEHAAMLIAFHTMVALFHRERTGAGQRVDVNLFDAAIDFQCQELTAALNMDVEFERSEAGIAQAWLGGPYGIYETADGHVAIAMAPMAALAETLSLPELADYDTPQATFDHRDEIKRTLEAYTREQPTDELLETLLDADVWAAEVNDFQAVAADPQVQHNETLVELAHPEDGTFTTVGVPVEMSETPGDIRSPPPLPGQHTGEILAEIGYDAAERERLAEEGVVGGTVQ